jgi:hypothetical protein
MPGRFPFLNGWAWSGEKNKFVVADWHRLNDGNRKYGTLFIIVKKKKKKKIKKKKKKKKIKK